MRNGNIKQELRQAALELSSISRSAEIAEFGRIVESVCPFTVDATLVRSTLAYRDWTGTTPYRVWVISYALHEGYPISREFMLVAERVEVTAYNMEPIVRGIETQSVERVILVMDALKKCESILNSVSFKSMLPELLESSYEGEELLRYILYLYRLRREEWKRTRLPNLEETIAEEVSNMSSLDLDFSVRSQEYLIERYNMPVSDYDWGDLYTAKAWYKVFGRMPKDVHLYALNSWVVRGLKAHWKVFAKNLPLCTEVHDKIALGYLVCTFGNKVLDILKARTENIHDLGINLAIMEGVGTDYQYSVSTICPEAADWLYANRKKRDWALLVRIAKSWEMVTEETDSRDVMDLKAVLESFVYEEVNHKGFSLEASKWGVAQDSYSQCEKHWLDGLQSRKSSNIPYVEAKEGSLYMKTLAQDDPRGVFLGEYTNCCQHISGAGSTCAWQGHEEGAFVAVFYGEQIVAQSWVWRHQDTVCFDNVEALGTWAERPELLSLYKMAAEQMLGRLGVCRVVVGGGEYDDMGVSHLRKMAVVPTPMGCYTDAKNQYLLAERRES